MRPKTECLLSAMAVLLLILIPASGQTGEAGSGDLSRRPTLYVVGYAHLDTQWRWDYARTIGEFIPKTMRDNFALIEKYPHYVFNFSGANRYRMMQEYYPGDYERVKKYVAAGRWFPSGSAMEESDVNTPSAESLIRQILYGTQYFRREFGKTSAEYMLPDCFGFPASLPSILAHCGIKGFSTQKLTWQSATRVGGEDSPEKSPEGIPFNVGVWEGLDGRSVIAALNPGSYVGRVRYDLSKSPPPDAADSSRRRRDVVDWPARIDLNGKVSGLYTDYMYYGTGDTGGAPDENSVRLLEAIVTKGLAVLPPDGVLARDRQDLEPGREVRVGEGPVTVVSADAERMFLDMEEARTDRLPRYKGDLELTNHSAGSLTSQAYMKRWNRLNEVLADAAERASVAARWLGGRAYPLRRLNDAWTLVTGGQFHDIIPGTSIPKAYEYSWNDEILALNQFAGVVTSAAEAIASALDTTAEGEALVVYNPLNIEREDVVEARISFPTGVPRAVRVFGPDGKEVPAQLADASNGAATVVFMAKAPSVGFSVYDVRPSEAQSFSSEIKATRSSLENERYRISLNENGDVTGIFDKIVDKELLAAPVRMAVKTDKPVDWPAWNMDWEDQEKPPRSYFAGPARIRVVERGPARAAIEVARSNEGSTLVQTIRLAAGGAGDRVEFHNILDWKTPEANLKAAFPLTASNPLATYNWDIGTIERGNSHEKMFEYASHQWFDLTDRSGSYGITFLSDCKYGTDKPDDSSLRLTLVRTPGIGTGNGRSYSDQATQDWGRHEFLFGLAGHIGDWRQGQSYWQALRLNQPLMVFTSPKHGGDLGRSFSFLRINSSRVRVLALKKAEQSDEVVIRMVELDGLGAGDVHIAFPVPISGAREIDGAERPLGSASVTDGEIVADFAPYQVRTFALKLDAPPRTTAAPRSEPVRLDFDQTVASRDGERKAYSFDAFGRSLPAEMLPEEIPYGGISFRLAPAGKADAVVARGQKIQLPEGEYTRLYLLAASAGGDRKAVFRIGDRPVEILIQDWGGYVGQWDNRTWKWKEEPAPERAGSRAGRPRMRTVQEYEGLTAGFIKPAPVAWFASHRHSAEGANEPYAYAYLYACSVEMKPGDRFLTLPDDRRIRILAVTVSDEKGRVRPASPLYDTLERSGTR